MRTTDQDQAAPKPRINLGVVAALDVLVLMVALPGLSADGVDTIRLLVLAIALAAGTGWIAFRRHRTTTQRSVSGARD